MKPITNEKLVKVLRSCAEQIDLPYEERHEDFEDGMLAWALREAADRLEAQDGQP